MKWFADSLKNYQFCRKKFSTGYPCGFNFNGNDYWRCESNACREYAQGDHRCCAPGTHGSVWHFLQNIPSATYNYNENTTADNQVVTNFRVESEFFYFPTGTASLSQSNVENITINTPWYVESSKETVFNLHARMHQVCTQDTTVTSIYDKATGTLHANSMIIRDVPQNARRLEETSDIIKSIQTVFDKLQRNTGRNTFDVKGMIDKDIFISIPLTINNKTIQAHTYKTPYHKHKEWRMENLVPGSGESGSGSGSGEREFWFGLRRIWFGFRRI